MTSSKTTTPSKKRKRDSSPPTRNLDFFFAKRPNPNSVAEEPEGSLTDEQLARKLQAAEDALAAPSAASHETIGTDEALARKLQTGWSASEDATRETPQVLTLQPTSTTAEDVISSIPLTQDIVTFNPSTYTDLLERAWQQGSATYSLLTHSFTLINSTRSRIAIITILTNTLRVLLVHNPTSLLPAIYLCTNTLSPPWVPTELGIGGSLISKGLKRACGLDDATLRSLHHKLGDAGDVAATAKRKQSRTLVKPKPLTIKGVYESLLKIADAKGKGSQEIKQGIVEGLIRNAQGPEECRFIVRTLSQHLRIGAVRGTMLIALARACAVTQSTGREYVVYDIEGLRRLAKADLAGVWAQAEERVKAAFAKRPDYGLLVPRLMEVGVKEGTDALGGMQLHVPVMPMLGGITRDVGEMIQTLRGRAFTCEYKYDGQRAQVHCDGEGKVKIFSRHLEDMTEKYPDLVALVPKVKGEVKDFVLEGEVVAVDRETGELKPFQTLANRAKKDVGLESVKVDVCFFAFDLMFVDGEELLDNPLRERRGLLRSLFVQIPHHFTWVESLDAEATDLESVSAFLKKAIAAKCEGIMVKVLDNLADAPEKRKKALLATYEPDKRLDSWLKVKKDYSLSADTIDLIPVGGWHGQGRKNAWWSPILLACRNEESGTLEVVTKCMSGFTDAFYKANKEKYSEDGINVISRPAYIEYAGEPNVWFEPQEVWEMAFADITLSPTYTAAIGLVSEERGLSLRFPRFLRVKEDKTIEEASTNEFLAELYRKQGSKKEEDSDHFG